MLAAQLGQRHTAFSLPEDRDDLRFRVSTCFHSRSPLASCRENSTYPAPPLSGGLPIDLELVSVGLREDLSQQAKVCLIKYLGSNF